MSQKTAMQLQPDSRVLVVTPHPQDFSWLTCETTVEFVQSEQELIVKTCAAPAVVVLDDRLDGLHENTLTTLGQRFPLIYIVGNQPKFRATSEVFCSLIRPVVQEELQMALRLARPQSVTWKQWMLGQLHSWLPSAVTLITTTLLWQAAIIRFHIPDYILPAPRQIFDELFASGDLWHEAGLTTLEAGIGLCLGVSCGWLMGICFAYSRLIERSLFPWVLALKVTPIIAIAPLIAMWVQNDWWTKVIVAALVCFFPLVIGTTQGLRIQDPEAEWLFRSLNAGTWKTFWKLRLPRALPLIWASLKVAAPLASIGAIVAEFCGANQGIGYVIKLASANVDTTRMFAAIVVAALSSACLYTLVVIPERFAWWQKKLGGTL